MAAAPPTPDQAVFTASINAIKTTNAAVVGTMGHATARRNVPEDQRNNAVLVATWVPNELRLLAAAKRRYLFGVSFSEVAAAAMIQIAAARHLQAPNPLLRDMVFSVFVAYTVSRDWVIEYNNLHSSSILRQFEIDGRQVDRSDPMFAKNGWVNQSRMNSTAVHAFGYLVVEAAPDGGTLHLLKTTKGTPFTDHVLQTPQGKLITEWANAIDDADRHALDLFKPQFRILASVVDAILGEVGVNVEDASAKAIAMRPAEF